MNDKKQFKKLNLITNFFAQIFVLVVFLTSCHNRFEEKIVQETDDNKKLSYSINKETYDSFECIIDREVQNEGHWIEWQDDPSVINLSQKDIADLEMFYENLYSDSLIKNIEQLKTKSLNFVLLASAIFDSRFGGDICLYDSRNVLFQTDWKENRVKEFNLSNYNKLETFLLNDSELRMYFTRPVH